jgi:hypothetical protein
MEYEKINEICELCTKAVKNIIIKDGHNFETNGPDMSIKLVFNISCNIIVNLMIPFLINADKSEHSFIMRDSVNVIRDMRMGTVEELDLKKPWLDSGLYELN